MNQSNLTEQACQIWAAGVKSVNAEQRMREFVSVTERQLCFGSENDANQMQIDHADYRNLIVVGAGKASGDMATGFEQACGEQFMAEKKVMGLINVPDDKIRPTKAIRIVGCRPAGINLPTERVLVSTAEIIKLVSQCHPDDLCLFLIAGGGSALLERPVEGVTLADFQSVTKLLSHRGAPIEDLNAVRRRISQVKGGGLARLANCRRMVTLLISDVLGDPLNVIASGPTVISDLGQSATELNATAIDVLKRYDADLTHVPISVLKALNRSEGLIPASITTATECEHFIIGNNEWAVAAAKRKATELGFASETETDRSADSAETVGGRLADKLLILKDHPSGKQKGCFISGGEPTVHLCASPGKGGRNQQLALAAMLELIEKRLANDRSFCFLAGGTDGEDGNVPVAGGVFNSTQLQSMQDETQYSRIRSHLSNNDSYTFLKEVGCLLDTGPTGTNVCDLRVLVWE